MNILELKGKSFPSWYFKKVLRPEDLDNFQFYYMGDNFDEEIEVEKIVGTTHVNYYHKAWLEMLTKLKRHKDDYDSELIKEVILRQIDQSVAEYDGNYYITSGNHRFCQAKFLGVPTVSCNVQKFLFNEEDYNLYQELLKSNFTCDYSRGNFQNIKLGDTFISVSDSREDIYSLIEIYKSVRISRVEKYLMRNKKAEDFIRFKNDKEFIDELKAVIIRNNLYYQ